MALISPYISEGSGLKPMIASNPPAVTAISPYISEGSGLKLLTAVQISLHAMGSPLTSVRGAD